jgi:transposase
MKFTIKQFNETFPNDDTCLQFMFDKRYGNMTACTKCGVTNPSYYRVRNRKCYECKDCGYQIHPLANTIFHKSDTSLKSWFYAIYLFSASKNGVSAKELERHLGVTYKTAWRIAKHIRLLMQ